MPLFHGRTLAFDEPASTAYGTLRAQARAQSLAFGDFDALIASALNLDEDVSSP